MVDEVGYTGRTARAALEAVIALGRPERVQMAVLVDRGHREFPIQPDFCGKSVLTKRGDHIDVRLKDYEGEDAVVLVEGEEES